MATHQPGNTSRLASLQNWLLKDSAKGHRPLQTMFLIGVTAVESLSPMLPWTRGLWLALLGALWVSGSFVRGLGLKRLYVRGPKDALDVWDCLLAGAAVAVLLGEWATLLMYLLSGVLVRYLLSYYMIKRKGHLRCESCSAVATKEHEFCPNCRRRALEEIQSE